MWVRTKPKKGAFANRTVNGSAKVGEEVGECESEWLMVTGMGVGLNSALVQHSRASHPALYSGNRWGVLHLRMTPHMHNSGSTKPWPPCLTFADVKWNEVQQNWS